MKNTVKRLLGVLLLLAALFSTCSCGKYVSSYSATILIRGNVGGEVSVRFDSLKGRLCESLRKDKDGEGALSYTASLKEGSLTVYYAAGNGALETLFTLSGGEIISDVGGYIEGAKGTRIHIVIETDGKCKGGELRIDFYQGENA